VSIISRYVSPPTPGVGGDILGDWVRPLVTGDIELTSLAVEEYGKSPGYPLCCWNVMKSFGHDCDGNKEYDGMNEEHWSGISGETSRELTPRSFSN
jgi:hypothetical protein